MLSSWVPSPSCSQSTGLNTSGSQAEKSNSERVGHAYSLPLEAQKLVMNIDADSMPGRKRRREAY